MLKLGFSLLCGALLLASEPILAQTGEAESGAASQAPAAIDPAAQCELHVWPGRSFHSVYYGWAHGGTVDGAQKGRNGYPALPEDPLSTQVQLAELEKLPLAEMLGLPDYRTVFHNQPLSAKAIRYSTGRQVADSPPCYAELMVDDIVFQNNVINGKFLNVIYRFRQFDGTSPTPVRTFGTYILARLSLFPPSDPQVDPQPALNELINGFSHTAVDFGTALIASEAKKNKKKK